MTRLILGSFLIFAVLVCPNAEHRLSNPFSILEMVDTLTIRYQNILYWVLKAQGDPDETAEETLRRVKEISSKMDEMHVFFNQKSDSSVMKINDANINYDKFSTATRIIDSANAKIDNEFKKYLRFLYSTIDNGTIEAYLDENKNQITSLEEAISTLFNVVKPVRSDSRQLEDIIEYLNSAHTKRCDQGKSSEQWLFYLINNIVLSEIRAYTVMAFHHTLKINNGIENRKQYFIDHLQHFQNEFEHRTGEYVKRFPTALDTVSRDIRRCDPAIPKRRGNYFEFEKLYQSFLMNSDQIRFPCPICENIKFYPGHLLKSPNENPEFKYKIYQSCKGQILDCKNLSPPYRGGLKVCLREEYERRRYDWFIDGGYDIYGTNKEGGKNNCDGGSIKNVEVHQHIKLQSARFALNDVKFCNYCLCTCAQTNDTTSDAVRAVSLRRQRSNIKLNRVVVGVRLVLQNNIVHIQIKEGELLKEGNIKDVPENSGWVPLDIMNIHRSYREENGNKKRVTIKEDQDYAYIDKYNNTMILDDYLASADMVIVGVGFENINNYYYKWKAIGMSIMMAPFDWATGKIDEGGWTSLSVGRINTQDINNKRFGKSEISLDDPFKSLNNLPLVERGVVRFTKSDLVKDAGQSVYPYFDSQPVETNPSFPLGGIGLFKRGAEGFGGFVAPKIYTVKITPPNLNYTVTSIIREGTHGTK